MLVFIFFQKYPNVFIEPLKLGELSILKECKFVLDRFIHTPFLTGGLGF